MDQANINEILDFAISREQQAHDFYMDLAEKMDREEMKEVFRNFAGEELKHRAKIEAIKANKYTWKEDKKIMDLKISEQVEDVKPESVIDYQRALILAMKREKEAYKLYMNLAETAPDENVKKTFLGLANEEAKHKLRFELEYDDFVMQEN